MTPVTTTTKPPRVRTAEQSPLDPRRWCVTLSCGHEAWITADRRPLRRTTRDCPHGCQREPGRGP